MSESKKSGKRARQIMYGFSFFMSVANLVFTVRFDIFAYLSLFVVCYFGMIGLCAVLASIEEGRRAKIR